VSLKQRAFSLHVPLALLAGCDARVTNIGSFEAGIGVYLEAEDGALSGGFTIANDGRASGGRFIMPTTGATSDDAPGPARALYQLDVKETGTYFIWGRIHSQDTSQNRFFFRVDDGDFVKWRITTGDVWFWDALHDDVDYGTPIAFALTAGPHQLTFANCVDGASLDRLFYGPSGEAPAPNDTMCNPPHSVEYDGGCNPSCGSLRGQCGGPLCAGLPLTATYDCPACCMLDQ
jgi:hypothetical protein